MLLVAAVLSGVTFGASIFWLAINLLYDKPAEVLQNSTTYLCLSLALLSAMAFWWLMSERSWLRALGLYDFVRKHDQRERL